jgi:hypothetical protein
MSLLGKGVPVLCRFWGRVSLLGNVICPTSAPSCSERGSCVPRSVGPGSGVAPSEDHGRGGTRPLRAERLAERGILVGTGGGARTASAGPRAGGARGTHGGAGTRGGGARGRRRHGRCEGSSNRLWGCATRATRTWSHAPPSPRTSKGPPREARLEDGVRGAQTAGGGIGSMRRIQSPGSPARLAGEIPAR